MPSTPDLTERPLRKDAERNRQRIIEAAGQLFAERGLGVTLDDVARHAGVGVGTVYRRFPGKEDLVEALFAEEIDLLVARAEQALEEANLDTDRLHVLPFPLYQWRREYVDGLSDLIGQVWFWTDDWQTGEREASEDIARGRVRRSSPPQRRARTR